MGIGSFTYPWSANILKYLFQNIALPANPPWVGIGKANGSKSAFIEFSGANYARVQLDSSYFSTATTGETGLIQEVLFPISEGYSGETYSIGFFTSSTAQLPFAWGDCKEREVIKTHDSLRILPGAYSHYFNPGATWSLWLKNKILNHMYRGESLALGSTDFEFAYTLTPCNDTTPGTEPGAGGYVRAVVARNSTNFIESRVNGQELNVDVPFEYSTDVQGTAVNLAIFCADQYLMWATLPTAAPININQRLMIQRGTLFQLDPAPAQELASVCN